MNTVKPSRPFNMLLTRLILVMVSVLLASFAHSAVFDAAVPIWTTAEKGAINSSVAFTTHFDWDGKSPLLLRLAGCSIFKVFVNGEFAAYGPARGPHGWFRMDEWDLSRVAHKGENMLRIVGVAYNTTTYYIVEHEPFLQAEVLAGGKVVRATGTLWEFDSPKASCNHAFASYLAILLEGIRK